MNTQKSKILEAEKTDSLAVRMALGETQLVAETREFLTANGVKLDVFGQVLVKLFEVFFFVNGKQLHSILVASLPNLCRRCTRF